MTESYESAVCALWIGVGATAVMDLWTVLRARLLHVPPFNYGLLGRWLAYLPRGRLIHRPIAATPRVPGEALLGWTAHYLIGIAFAALLLAIWGGGWARHPTLAPALLTGIGTVLAPFFILQPAMGAGVAGRRTPRPGAVRRQALITHTVFGFGLYFSAWLLTRADAVTRLW